MGETPRGERRFERGNIERDPDFKTRARLEEFDQLLGTLVEKGVELSGQTKRDMRARVQALLIALGMKGLDDYEGFLAIHERLQQTMRHLPTTVGYPDRPIFEQRLTDLSLGSRREDLPDVLPNPLATDVATFGQCNWIQLKGRGGKDITEYLYELGKVLSSEFAYTSVFDEIDAIKIGKQWKIENGRHRAMALRALGPQYVDGRDMDRWIVVRREDR